MTPIYLKHAQHGKKIASLRIEAETDKKNGWQEVSKDEYLGVSKEQEVKTEKVNPDLAERYKAKFGKAPHHKMKPETIEAALNDPSA